MENELGGERLSLFFSCLRRAERHLPVQTLYSLLKPLAFARATLNTAIKNPHPGVPLPECLEAHWTSSMARQRRMSHYLNHYLQYFPDRLADAKWKDHCRILGLDKLLEARQDGRAVVVAYCHFGPILVMRSWVRAGGIPCAALVGGESENHPKLMRKTDRLVRYPHLPTRFYLDQLKAAAKFLAGGNVLFVAIDGPPGKRIDVPFCDGWTFQMATGAMRLAIRHEAELIPCSIVEEGPWKFRIEVGKSVPRELLIAESQWPCAGEHLLAEMRPHFQAHPEQCGLDLVQRLRSTSSARRPARANS